MVVTCAYSTKTRDEYIYILYIDKQGYYRSYGIASSDKNLLPFLNQLEEMPIGMLNSFVNKHSKLI